MGILDKFRRIICKNKQEDKFTKSRHSITITSPATNKTAFNEVVNMFCDEVEEQTGVKINSNDFMEESPLKDVKIIKFTLPIPSNLCDDKGWLFDVIKKNTQLKIKGIKKYKSVQLIGVKKLYIESSEIKNFFNIIKNDEQLRNFDGPLYLNLQLLFYTVVFDYERFTNFTKQIDKYLNLPKIDYVDVKKRIIDAVADVTERMYADVSKETETSRKEIRDILSNLGKQGAIKLIFMRNFTWYVEDIKKNVSILDKFSKLMEFMQETLNSEGPHKDALIPIFELSTDLDYVSAHGCYATINDKTGLDESVILAKIPNKLKELSK